jgi:hypothetical protein
MTPNPMHRLLARSAALALTLILAVPAPAGAIDNLGRLFFTPQQRQDLDRRRQANIREAVVTQESLITVNGHVARSSGKATTWINGVPQEDSRPTGNPARAAIGGGEGEAQVDLKVGQTLDRTRGEIKDELGGGKIVVPSEKRGRTP